MLPSCTRTGMCFEIPRAPGSPFPSLSSACPGEEGMALPPEELRASALPGCMEVDGARVTLAGTLGWGAAGLRVNPLTQ